MINREQEPEKGEREKGSILVGHRTENKDFKMRGREQSKEGWRKK